MPSLQDDRRTELLTALSLSPVAGARLTNTDLYRRFLALQAGVSLDQAAARSERDLGGKHLGRTGGGTPPPAPSNTYDSAVYDTAVYG